MPSEDHKRFVVSYPRPQVADGSERNVIDIESRGVQSFRYELLTASVVWSFRGTANEVAREIEYLSHL